MVRYEVFLGVKRQLAEVFRENRVGAATLAEQQQERDDCIRQANTYLLSAFSDRRQIVLHLDD